MDKVYDTPTQCCGCGVCADICPVNAISMLRKDMFSYPQIDTDLCIRCGACRRVCVIQTPVCPPADEPLAFAAQHKRKDVRLHSSSGGVFTALSDVILERGGVVCGAVFGENMYAEYAVAASANDRQAMRGSKYVQSDSSRIYADMERCLQAGKEVLFTGTPCAVAAVKRRFAAFEDLLYTADILCHGVPSPAVWERYIDCLQERYGQAVTDYTFRDKQNGWHDYHAVVTFADGTTAQDTPLVDSYLDLFRYDLALRPSCTACPYATRKRVGDVTFGDFWGIERVLPALDDDTGVSALLVNTPRGERLLSLLRERLELYPCTAEDIAVRQPPMQYPSAVSVKGPAFARDFERLPFEKVLKKYTRLGVKRRVIDLVKNIAKK